MWKWWICAGAAAACFIWRTMGPSDLNSSPPSDAYMRQWTVSALVQIMACRLFGASGTNFSEFSIKIQKFSFMKIYLKLSSAKRRPFCAGVGVGWGWGVGGGGVNILRPEWNGQHFADTFKCIFVKEELHVLFAISLQFVPEGLMDNITSL